MNLPNGTATLAASTPPVAVVTANFFGLSLPDVVQLATLMYLSLLILHKLAQMIKEWKTGKGSNDANS